MKIKAVYIYSVSLAVMLSIVIAWGASNYYGMRRMGQEDLLPQHSDIVTYADFEWHMENESEIIVDDKHISNYAFNEGHFEFDTVDDTYFNMNLRGQKLFSTYHFLISIDGQAEKESGQIYITLSQKIDSEEMLFVSDPFELSDSKLKEELDLTKVIFRKMGDRTSEFYWGKDILWADGLRFDWDNFDKTRIYLDSIIIRSGVRYDYRISEIFEEGTKEQVTVVKRGKGLKLDKSFREGSFITPALGIGTIRRFHDVVFDELEGPVVAEVRSGDTDNNWTPWLEIGSDGLIESLPANSYIQFKFSLKKIRRFPAPSLKGFSIRVLDPSPPGMGGPLFGIAHLPRYMPGKSLDRILQSSSHTVWVRLPFRNPMFDQSVNELVASDVNIVASISLDSISKDKLIETINKHRSKILVWNLYSNTPKGIPYFTDIFTSVREINPAAIIFPERITHEYFQELALKGLYEFTESQTSQAEILDRGFWWFFIVVLIGILLVVALGPVIGYNFRFKIRDLLMVCAGLGMAAIIIIPIILISGWTQLALPRDFAHIQIAFSRFLLSSGFQEFLHALILLLIVRYSTKAGVSEKTAWTGAIIFSSLLLGSAHIGYPGFSGTEVAGFIAVASIAFAIIGYVFYRSKSLISIWIIHFVFNMFLSTMTAIGQRI